MRPFEVVLVVLTLVGLLGRWMAPVVQRLLAGALAVVAVVHVVVEGPRWQLVPAYVVAIVVVAAPALRLLPRRAPGWVPVVGRGIGALLLVIAVALGVVLPVPSLPRPDGPYDVGTTRWEVVDDTRTEVYGADPGGPRRLMATAWYPTDQPGPASPWVDAPGPFAQEVAGQVGVPPVALGHLRLVTTAATTDAPVADPPADGWPVVVYSHGWGGFASIQSDLTEQLASEGAVVLALDHTYGAAVTTFPDGTVAPQDPGALPDVEDVGQAAYDAATVELEATFAQDVAALLDRMAGGQGPAVLPGDGLALDRVALTGHSTGGGAMVRLCVVDPRCAGVMGLDPWVEPVPAELRAHGLDVPLVSVRSEQWQGDANDALLRDLHTASSPDLGMYVVPGAEHRDFTLLPFLSPLATTLGLSGDVDAAAMHEAIDELASAFVARALHGETGPLPALPVLVRD